MVSIIQSVAVVLHLAVLLWISVIIHSIQSAVEAKHWPDFSCFPVKPSTQQQKTVRHYKMGWESCRGSFEKYKGQRSKNTDPFNFVVDEFINIMLQEMGYEEEDKGEAPQEIVKNVTKKLQVCKTKHREYETMKNFNNLPCEPYNDLFQCVDKAVGCPV